MRQGRGAFWPAAFAALVACQSAFGDEQPAIARYSPARPPRGTEAVPVQWITVAGPDRHSMLAAVARPHGAGPFPAVVVLHGSHGFAREYVQLAEDLSSIGVIAVAACWFSGGVGAGQRFITPIDCPDGPPMGRAPDPSVLQTVDTIIEAVRTLPGVRADRIGVFGHSRGGGAALHYAITMDKVRAVALNSTGYPSDLANRVSDFKASILILHGTADAAADGGSPMTDVQMARTFEANLRRVGARVEAEYYPGGRHNGIFADPQQHKDELQRIGSFFARHLLE